MKKITICVLVSILFVLLPFLSQGFRDDGLKETPDKTIRGKLFVKTDPKNSRVRILNIKPKFYQGMVLDSGSYHVEVSKQGYEPTKMWINLEAGEAKRLEIKLERRDAKQKARKEAAEKKAAEVETQRIKNELNKAPTAPATNEIKAIRPEFAARDVAKVIFELNGPFHPQTMVIEGKKPRVVCDFPDADLASDIGGSIEVNNGIVEKIRTGIHKRPKFKVRVVLDLVPERNYEIGQFFFEKENYYVLVIKAKE